MRESKLDLIEINVLLSTKNSEVHSKYIFLSKHMVSSSKSRNFCNVFESLNRTLYLQNWLCVHHHLQNAVHKSMFANITITLTVFMCIYTMIVLCSRILKEYQRIVYLYFYVQLKSWSFNRSYFMSLRSPWNTWQKPLIIL